MKFLKYYNGFKNYLEIKGYADNTIENYSNDIKCFLNFLSYHYMRLDEISNITKEIVLDYCDYLRNYRDKKGSLLTASTQCKKLSGLKTFFNYLLKNDFILKQPFDRIDFPKQEERLPKNILTVDEVMEILNACKLTSPVQIRNKAIIETAYSTGIRTSELCDLKLIDIDLKQQVLTVVKGKGNRSRTVPIGQYAVEYIRLYLDKARKHLLKGKKDNGYLFLTSPGNKFNRHSVNESVIRPVVKRTNIKKHVSYYSFRHSIATHLLKNNVDIRFVSELLGHKKLSTTMIYTHVNITDLKKVHSMAHPREL